MKAGIAYIRKELAGLYSSGEIERFVFLIFEKLKGYDRTRFLLSREEILTTVEQSDLIQIVNRLKAQEPIQYILGETIFYDLPFICRPGVLIPRPETEELVDWIIQQNEISAPTILDVGTGTGCIAITLKKNIPEAKVLACDISTDCLDLAGKNSEVNDVDIQCFEWDVLNQKPATTWPAFHIIVSNPPYVTGKEKKQMERNVLDFEPELALFVPDDNALLFYKRIADLALDLLVENGTLYFEINEAYGSECASMLQDKGFQNIQIRKDINGKDRMIYAKRKNKI